MLSEKIDALNKKIKDLEISLNQTSDKVDEFDKTLTIEKAALESEYQNTTKGLDNLEQQKDNINNDVTGNNGLKKKYNTKVWEKGN